MSHSTHMNESWHPHEWAMSHIWMSHGTRMNKSWHTYEWVMTHLWMQRALRRAPYCLCTQYLVQICVCLSLCMCLSLCLYLSLCLKLCLFKVIYMSVCKYNHMYICLCVKTIICTRIYTHTPPHCDRHTKKPKQGRQLHIAGYGTVHGWSGEGSTLEVET